MLGLTPAWYRKVLKRLPPEAELLDVGVGTGGALARNSDLVQGKRLRIVGLDIDEGYLKQCRRVMQQVGLSSRVSAIRESIYEYQGGPYDAVYFSMSFMLMTEPVRALQHVAKLLKPGGRIYFTQTFHRRRSLLAERMKPLLFHFTTIRFGQVTYEEDFRSDLQAAQCVVEQNEVLGGSRGFSYRMIVARVQTVANGARLSVAGPARAYPRAGVSS